jgi:hypothetical protein
VDVEGTEAQYAVQAPQVEIYNLDISHDDPALIEVAPTQAEQAPETPAPVALPAQAPGLRISMRVRSQANQGYTPSISGSKCSYAVTQLESQGVLNPDIADGMIFNLFHAPGSLLHSVPGLTPNMEECFLCLRCARGN